MAASVVDGDVTRHTRQSLQAGLRVEAQVMRVCGAPQANGSGPETNSGGRFHSVGSNHFFAQVLFYLLKFIINLFKFRSGCAPLGSLLRDNRFGAYR